MVGLQRNHSAGAFGWLASARTCGLICAETGCPPALSTRPCGEGSCLHPARMKWKDEAVIPTLPFAGDRPTCRERRCNEEATPTDGQPHRSCRRAARRQERTVIARAITAVRPDGGRKERGRPGREHGSAAAQGLRAPKGIRKAAGKVHALRTARQASGRSVGAGSDAGPHLRLRLACPFLRAPPALCGAEVSFWRAGRGWRPWGNRRCGR